MAKQFEPQEFTTSISDQDGLLRSRIPTPMIKLLKGQHGDAFHFTVTGPDTVEIKLLRGRGASGERPLQVRPKVEKPSAVKKTATKTASKAPAAASKGATKGPLLKPSQKGGSKKKKVAYDVPGGSKKTNVSDLF